MIDDISIMLISLMDWIFIHSVTNSIIIPLFIDRNLDLKNVNIILSLSVKLIIITIIINSLSEKCFSISIIPVQFRIKTIIIPLNNPSKPIVSNEINTVVAIRSAKFTP